MNEACDHINSEVEQEAALKKKTSEVSVFVGLWQGLHSPEYNGAS